MTRRFEWRLWREPAELFGAAVIGSGALWGSLWVTSPTTSGVCGCGDPSLFQWFLAWPAHAIATGHSLVFSRDLFHPAGVNLLANTSVLALGVPLSPVTWLFGPVLTENVALLLAVPVAVVGMDLFLRRVTASLAARVVLSLCYGFSPFVLSSLTESHLMTAWIGVLPLIALGVLDALAADPRRARRGKILLVVALVAQFFLSTELFLLCGIVTVLVVAILVVNRLVDRRVASGAVAAARRLAAPLVAAGVVLGVPAYYALEGPRSLKGGVWGPGVDRSSWGTSLSDLVVPHRISGGLIEASGYLGAPFVKIQLLGWGLVSVAVLAAIWQRHDVVARSAALVALCCCALALGPDQVAWAPWRLFANLPVLRDVVELRFLVFAMLAMLVVLARALERIKGLGRRGMALGVAALAVVVVPVAVPVALGLPLHTAHVAIPAWWRAAHGPGVVLSYPFPAGLIQSPLTWQAHDHFAVALAGGGGPQGALARAGADEAAEALLVNLSLHVAGRVIATAPNAVAIREMLVRDSVTEVVVPVKLHGSALVTGSPSAGAAAFFMETLGIDPVVDHGAWVFGVHGPLPSPRIVSAARVRSCTTAATSPRASALWACLVEGAR
ncbi:MAG TPA: hypothetical protein VMQ40_04575 [Acidimicrobiales bacterium]|nr:hypothetical protein [Acidimicrobiales bacterium]